MRIIHSQKTIVRKSVIKNVLSYLHSDVNLSTSFCVDDIFLQDIKRREEKHVLHILFITFGHPHSASASCSGTMDAMHKLRPFK